MPRTHDTAVHTSQPLTLPTTPPTLQSSLAEEQPAGTKAAGPPGRLQLRHRTSSPESIQMSDHDTSADPRRRQQASSGLHDYDYSSERWVPYRHTNGVAIYYHSSNGRARSDGQRGEEYMASTIIKGTPQECLDVLINSGSHTTILGPASHITVLEQESDSQVSLHGCRSVLQRWWACRAAGVLQRAASAGGRHIPLPRSMHSEHASAVPCIAMQTSV